MQPRKSSKLTWDSKVLKEITSLINNSISTTNIMMFSTRDSWTSTDLQFCSDRCLRESKSQKDFKFNLMLILTPDLIEKI